MSGLEERFLENYSSVVYYHQEKPKWNEMIKLKIPVEKCSNLHLRFLFRHRSSNEGWYLA